MHTYIGNWDALENFVWSQVTLCSTLYDCEVNTLLWREWVGTCTWIHMKFAALFVFRVVLYLDHQPWFQRVGPQKIQGHEVKACSECCSADGNPDLESSAAASNKAKDAVPPFGMEHQTTGETKCILACISDRMLLRRKTHVFLHKEQRSFNSDQRPVTANYQLIITYRPFLTENVRNACCSNTVPCIN